MALATLFSTSLPIFVAFGGLAVLVVPWLIKLPRLAIGFLFLSLVAGQLIRLPLPGQGGGLLLSDLAVVILLLSALFYFLFSSRVFALLPQKTASIVSSEQSRLPLSRLASPKGEDPAQATSASLLCEKSESPAGSPSLASKLMITITPFILWSAFTLLIQSPSLGFSNTLVAASYWVRLTALLLLLPALTFLFRESSWRYYAWRGLYLTIALLTLLGIVQLIFLPNLSPYSSWGWDPHQLRLVSTWIDPNFFGAFLVMGLAVIVLGPKLKQGQRAVFALVVIFSLLATQSRSALVALVMSLLFTAPFWFVLGAKKLARKRLVFVTSVLSMFILLMLVIVVILWPRFVGLISIDPTVQARVTNIQKALPIIADNSLLGVGYNAYQFAARDAGAIGDFQNHSRAGTDNSLLTIWATTGLVGLFLFLVPWVYIFHQFIVDLRRFKHLVSFMGLLCVVVLFAHSQFVNSLIYSHLLITLIIIVALALSTAHYERKDLAVK